MISRRYSRMAILTVLTVVYAVAGKLSLQLAFVEPSASPVWPPAGIAFAALLVLGLRAWPAIFIGAFLVNATTAGNLATSFCIAGANTAEALCGAWLVNRFARGIAVFDRAQDVFKFVLIAAVSTAISASIGPMSLALAGFAHWSNYGVIWLIWWLGDLTGYFIFAPLILLWWTRPRWQEERRRTLEAIVLLVLIAGLAELVFGKWFHEFVSRYPIAFICGPLILWTAYRFTQRETITGVVILTGIALGGTLAGTGPFVSRTPNDSLLLLQAWAAVLTITTMTLAAALAERRRAEAELEQQHRMVQRADQTKDKFLAMLSHELRTPLTPVLALVDFLEAECGDSKEIREALATIRRNVILESRLIDDLLDLTRVVRGKFNIEREPTDAHEAIRQAVEICRAEIDAKELDLQLDLAAENACVFADPAKLRQIIWNLLKNAIKFTPERGKVFIISRNQEPETITITVQDTGVGMEPELIGRIFTPFEQGHAAMQRRYGGLGLGLAISKAIADAHGATLLASSDGHDRGAIFRLQFQTVDSCAPEISRDGSEPPRATRTRLRILLVDDHVDTCAALTNLLTRRGHAVAIAHDLRTAIELAGTQSFELLISDVGLPDGNGVELMTHLRNAGVRGIAISGFGMGADLEKSLAAGFSEHLVKPLDFSRLEAAIERAMRPVEEVTS